MHNDFTSKGLYVKNADGGDYEVRKHVEQKLCRKKLPGTSTCMSQKATWYEYMVHEIMPSFCEKRSASKRSFFVNAIIISVNVIFKRKFYDLDLDLDATTGNTKRFFL